MKDIKNNYQRGSKQQDQWNTQKKELSGAVILLGRATFLNLRD